MVFPPDMRAITRCMKCGGETKTEISTTDQSEFKDEAMRLRAEVASLKEELAATQSVGLRYARENDTLTQQLAAANGRVERMREVVRMFVGCKFTVSTQIDPRGHTWCEAYLDQVLPIADAALSDLPEADKEKTK